MSTLTRTQASEGAPEWRYILGRLQLRVVFDDFASALAFTNTVGAIAERMNHHPEIALRWGLVHLAVSSHDVGGITQRDLDFANEVVKEVETAGGRLEPLKLTETEIAIDALDIPAVLAFWQAILGYDTDGDDALVDPDRLGPAIWFQQMDEPREQRNRIHLDVTVAHDEADARLQAALAAGGRLLSDSAAPRFWVLADAEGNEACLCTWRGRDEYDEALAESTS